MFVPEEKALPLHHVCERPHKKVQEYACICVRVCFVLVMVITGI